VNLDAVQTPALIATSEKDLLLMGGNYGSTAARIYTSTDGGENWTKGADYDGGEAENIQVTKPRRANGAALVAHKGATLLIGGVGVKYWGNGVWKSTDNVNWTRVTGEEEEIGTSPNSFTGRAYHAAVSFKDNLYVMGSKTGKTSADVWKSTDDGATWTEVTATAPWGKRSGLQAVVFNEEIYIVGGGGTGSLIWKSADGIDWTPVAISATEIGSRQNFGAAAILTPDLGYDDKLDFVIFGGSGTGKANTWRTGGYLNPK